MLTRKSLVLVSALALALAACDDPAKDAPKATVSTAPPASAKATATPTASAATTAAATAQPTAAAATGSAVAAPAPSGSAAAAAPAGPPQTLTIEPSQETLIEFIGAKVTGKHSGKFEKFGGSITILGSVPDGGNVTLDIDLGSVKTDAQKLDTHLKSADFFDVEKYPKATFTSKEVKPPADKGGPYTLVGELDLHGTKKSISFPVRINVTDDTVQVTSEFSINRKDFGIVYAGMADDLIRDEVIIKVHFNLPRKKKG
jgi:polyisoprenoid-binding protein YceI